ncbi:hypothetical protein E5288_WYG001638 [Bos mutus]|uniref:Glycine N-acyltransferase-like protein n=1 Tax=Bos mutus TaxID=72004 RepID=A0A6B0S8R6_9CETA|nr:hypothetical protein [Bos mutus]
MDQTGEMRMAGTLPEYRAQGLVTHAIYQQAQCLLKRGFPVYAHVDPKNQIMQKMGQSLNHMPVPCDWNQWNFKSYEEPAFPENGISRFSMFQC